MELPLIKQGDLFRKIVLATEIGALTRGMGMRLMASLPFRVLELN